MDTEEIKQATETKHLGIKRNNKNNIDIEDRIKLARRTIYALLGPGLHARRGMSPVVAYKLWKTYVISRALYGIEVMNHTASDIIQLEKLLRKICRQIQGLPDRFLFIPRCLVSVVCLISSVSIRKLKSLCLFVSGTSSDLLGLILTKSLLVMSLTMSSRA
jgi:hypothetical protein